MTLLKKEVQRLGATVDTLELAGVLAQPWVSIVLSGAAKREHLESNVGPWT
jgi:aryl-alcohol dehydrogenase-like predicted oxidoreductase